MYRIYTKIMLFVPAVLYRLLQADKTRMIMRLKLISVILLVTFLQVSATSFAQKISFTKNNVSLEQLFTEIRSQTGYNVLWSVAQVNEHVELAGKLFAYRHYCFTKHQQSRLGKKRLVSKYVSCDKY